jgi:predicted nuclease of predicted toxin-antitoxin system
MNKWEIWIDTNISPIIAKWIFEFTAIPTKSSFSLNLHFVDDITIYKMAQIRNKVIILTKDEDFKELIDWFGAPPKAIIIKFGNCSNKIFWEKLKPKLKPALEILLNENADVNVISLD